MHGLTRTFDMPLKARALYMPARPHDNVEIIPSSLFLNKEKAFRDQVNILSSHLCVSRVLHGHFMSLL